ncbi:MAG: lysophospholipid acyltransferase family protein [Gammaproteobacteria bacterium]
MILPLAWLAGHAPHLRGAVPTFGLLLGYLWCETAGIVASLFFWVRHRDTQRFVDANYRLQSWWANTLKVIAERLFRLTFEISDAEVLGGNGVIMLPRHASIADTLIPMVFYAIPRDIRLRYVLKKELLLDPCLDIVGNRIPNYFVDRAGQDSERAIAGVAALAGDLEPGEGVLLYPEGTRFSIAKAETLRRRWCGQPDLLEQLNRWPNLLPPRLGGTLALLEHNPGRDVVFCAHTGFEGSTRFMSLVNGSWCDARIRVHFWRVPYGAVPVDGEGQHRFLFEQWDRMERWVSLHQWSDEGE